MHLDGGEERGNRGNSRNAGSIMFILIFEREIFEFFFGKCYELFYLQVNVNNFFI